MTGLILEWQNDKGLRKGLLTSEKQVPSLWAKGKGVVYILDEGLNCQKNDSGEFVMAVVTLSKVKNIDLEYCT